MPFGIEFEVANVTYHEIADVGRCFPNWVIKADVTIKPYGEEIVSPILNWGEKQQVFEVAAYIRAFTEGKGNKSCGLHIHNSGNYSLIGLDEKKVFKFYQEKKRSFRPNMQRRIDTARERVRGIGIHHEVISFPSRHRTVEFRMFNMCLHPRWIARCLHVVEEFENRANSGEFTKSHGELTESIKRMENMLVQRGMSVSTIRQML